MNNVALNIDASAVVGYTAKLETMARSALPVAVRSTLNKAAFDVKQVTMPKTSSVFVHRAPTFFKSQSKVNPAKGLDMATMAAEVGFLPAVGKPKESGYGTSDLEQQEEGGIIPKRAFIPLNKARAGGSPTRRVRAAMLLANIKSKIINAKASGAKTAAGKFISTAIHAGKGGFVIGNKVDAQGNKEVLFINSVKRKGRNTLVNSTPVYSLKGHRNVRVKQTRFMKIASIESGKKMEGYYIIEAQKQIAKIK